MKVEARAGVETALEVRDLSVELGKRPILVDVALDVPEGGWACIIGPNGAGKTTLVHAIAGLVRRTGSVRLFGRPIEELGRRERAEVSVCGALVMLSLRLGCLWVGQFSPRQRLALPLPTRIGPSSQAPAKRRSLT